MKEDQTHFGFKQVKREQKADLVKEIFSNVAKKYDLMNDLMSGGLHRIWKNKMLEEISGNPLQVVDVAGGTGDIAFRITKNFRKQRLMSLILIRKCLMSVANGRLI